MNFLQERDARRFFALTAAVCAGLLLFAALFAGMQAAELRALLAERERTIVTALLEQGSAPGEIVGVLQNARVSEPARELLDQLGRDGSTPVWLLDSVRTRAAQTLRNALLPALLLAALQLWGTAHYLRRRDAVYREATTILSHYAQGDFRRRLPRAEEGALYQLFAAADQLSTALQARIEAERGSRAFLKDMLSDISHQLKTPLSALQMYMDILTAEPEEADTVRTFTAKSLASLARMESLIGALLKIARLDAGSIQFSREATYAAELAKRAASELKTRAAREGKRLTLTGAEDAVLHCDPGWTAEALGNLIKNALDHTPCGGEVAVRWERSPLLVRFTVTDTGEGIAADDLHHIFKRFYRAAASQGRTGVGLGLPLARAIVEGQGGVLSVQSEPGEGAVFTASFLTKP